MVTFKRILIFSGPLLLLLAVIWNIRGAPEATVSHSVTAEPTPLQSEIFDNPSPALITHSGPETSSERLSVMSARRNGREFDADAVAEAQAQPEGWSLSRNRHDHLPLTSEQLDDGRVFIESHPLKFESLIPGDTVDLSIPHIDETDSYLIEKAEEVDGLVIFKGITEDGESRQLTAVSGDNFVAGSIKLENGEQYDFELVGGTGWIHASAKLAQISENDAVPDAVREGTAHE